MKKTSKTYELPTTEMLEKELRKETYKKSHSRRLRNTAFTIITIAAIAVLISTLFLPVLRIYGSSMSPYFVENDIAVVSKQASFERGDIIAFYYNNKILLKRVVAFSGEWVDIDSNGNVYINDELLDEPYLNSKALGECDLELPYQVPEDKFFVMGDNRATSVDSRSTSIGCISEEQIIGKVFFRIWPLKSFGKID